MRMGIRIRVFAIYQLCDKFLNTFFKIVFLSLNLRLIDSTRRKSIDSSSAIFIYIYIWRVSGIGISHHPFKVGEYGFKPRTRYQYCGIEQWLARQPHKLKVAGSNPAPASKKLFEVLVRLHYSKIINLTNFFLNYYADMVFNGQHIWLPTKSCGFESRYPLQKYGSVVQLVKILACHAREHGFESRRSRQYNRTFYFYSL